MGPELVHFGIKHGHVPYFPFAERRLYIVRNARLDPDWAHTERSIMSIAGRAINSLIHSQGIGDLYRIYAVAERDGVDFNLTFIPSTFNFPHKEEFDNEYMRACTTWAMGSKRLPWIKVPPGFTLPEAK